ncbi:Uncharacterised protein [Mycobacteroides abscessus]|uniref:Polyketide cyclase / dehydrase and lipid transport n=4 Tax=Mycobacteroides abscessus TaxID=36809 RepID=A0A829HS27_9MYCO|nr:hypothetical protein [Mycobacteroides abscessus]ESV56198.1 hypothetical protein L830_2022 [Mycobacteroides abscessus MAB_082312_2258]ESV64605.1 hypothetical protein L833_1991 [Mycobacteroides abscessus MAB_091912_2446]AGM29914.1 hypothetical protein MASS_3312 [Mycobacteroides abscessus subsp. bolletii 50594]AIC71678.1 hypothetical protein MYCMA_06420 [Mycobacteroides abscessus subsp. massiliense str. GO 06]AMU27159.1 hypothetical protein A3N96_18645 [Mycobacteroides abscessus]
MKTVYLETQLPTDADRVWNAMQYAGTFLYLCRGLFGIPALSGRTEPLRVGEAGTAWLWGLHLIPLYRHTIHVVEVDADNRTVRTNESGGILRTWNHTLHVEPIGRGRCRYSDSIDIDAGMFSAAAARGAAAIFRYRQRRWHRLVNKQLLPEGPAYTRQ